MPLPLTQISAVAHFPLSARNVNVTGFFRYPLLRHGLPLTFCQGDNMNVKQVLMTVGLTVAALVVYDKFVKGKV